MTDSFAAKNALTYHTAIAKCFCLLVTGAARDRVVDRKRHVVKEHASECGASIGDQVSVVPRGSDIVGNRLIGVILKVVEVKV